MPVFYTTLMHDVFTGCRMAGQADKKARKAATGVASTWGRGILVLNVIYLCLCTYNLSVFTIILFSLFPMQHDLSMLVHLTQGSEPCLRCVFVCACSGLAVQGRGLRAVVPVPAGHGAQHALLFRLVPGLGGGGGEPGDVLRVHVHRPAGPHRVGAVRQPVLPLRVVPPPHRE